MELVAVAIGVLTYLLIGIALRGIDVVFFNSKLSDDSPILFLILWGVLIPITVIFILPVDMFKKLDKWFLSKKYEREARNYKRKGTR